MSGIYGIYNSSNYEQSIDSALSCMMKWNLAYGDGNHHDISLPFCGIGICDEHITNAPVNSNPIIENDKYIAVIDAVIYNRTDLISQYSLSQTLSDEELLFECILSQRVSSFLQMCMGPVCRSKTQASKNA